MWLESYCSSIPTGLGRPEVLQNPTKHGPHLKSISRYTIAGATLKLVFISKYLGMYLPGMIVSGFGLSVRVKHQPML